MHHVQKWNIKEHHPSPLNPPNPPTEIAPPHRHGDGAILMDFGSQNGIPQGCDDRRTTLLEVVARDDACRRCHLGKAAVFRGYNW